MNKKRWGGLFFILMLAFFIPTCSENNETEESDAAITEPQEEEEAVDVPEDAVAVINGKVLKEETLGFYTLIEKIEIESNRYFELLELEGEEAEKRDAFWDDELKYLDNINVQLNNMLELYSMRLLAEEKHFDIAYEKVKAAIDEFNEQIAEVDVVQAMIEEYDREIFDRRLRDYMKTSLMRDRVVSDLEYLVRQDNPDASEEEINLILTQSYEDLYMDHMSDLNIQIYLD